MKDQQVIKKNSDLIWTIANLLRGPYRPPQYRRVMIPLTVLRRLDCVLESSKQQVLDLYKKFKSQTKTNENGEIEQVYNDETIEKMICKKCNVPFFNTSGFTFSDKKEGYYGSLLDDPPNLAANLTQFIAGFSQGAFKILDKFHFEEEIEKLDESNRLFQVVKEFSTIDLHPERVPNMAMGYLFEELVRRFNEQANEEAGDHFTPREVINLMVHLLYTGDDIYDPGIVKTIYDPTCGTGGMLSVSQEYILKHNENANLELFGQEYNPEAYAICGSDLLIKGADVENIVFGNTLGTGRSKEGQVDGDGHDDKQFHYMLANPPFGVEWKPEKDCVTSEHNTVGFAGRFGPGLPRINDGALLFLLHMMSKMLPSPDQDGLGSRIGIVFNGSPLFTGDAGSGESNIRRWIIENDMLDAVIGLPDQLFYNTGIFTYIWIITNRKKPGRKGKVQLINATKCFVKMKKSLGNKRNEIGNGKDGKPNHIGELTRMYGEFKENDTEHFTVNGDIQEAASKVFDNRDFGYLKITVNRPLKLNFAVTDPRINTFKESSYYLGLAQSKKRKDKDSIVKEEKAGQELQAEIIKALESVKGGFDNNKRVKNRAVFEQQLKVVFKKARIDWNAALKKALLSTDGLAIKDPTAEACLNTKKEPEPDADLRDTENVKFPDDIELPLPLDYETAKNKGKVDKEPLLELVREHCETYLKDEVIPYRPDAWIDFDKTKVGYEIPFTRHFYKYEPPRPLEDIEADIKGLETEIVKMLNEVTQ